MPNGLLLCGPSGYRPAFHDDTPQTLAEIGKTLDLSCERVRQIEVRAFEKLQKAMKRMDKEARAPKTIDAEEISAST